MKKIINPCKVAGYASIPVSVFCRIEFSKDGRLSITGVIGPMSTGDARGGCGQIDDALRETLPEEITFTEGWNAELFEKFLSAWERWHLNDMRSGCEHQRAAWDTGKEIKIVKVNVETWKIRDAENRASVSAALAGKLFSAPRYFLGFVVYEALQAAKCGDIYRPKSDAEKTWFDAGVIKITTETTTAGWVRKTEHPEGLLCKPCPVCGYKYGSAWKREEVPAEVLAFLESLPDSTITPAWV